MSTSRYILLDWRPISVAAKEAKLLREYHDVQLTLPNDLNAAKTGLGVEDVYLRNDGFFLVSIKSERSYEKESILSYADTILHLIKDQKLKHVHHFHNLNLMKFQSKPILIDTSNIDLSSKVKSRRFLKRSSSFYKNFIELKAIDFSANSSFLAIELFKMKVGEVPETQQRFFNSSKPFSIRKSGSRTIAIAAYTSVLLCFLTIAYCTFRKYEVLPGLEFITYNIYEIKVFKTISVVIFLSGLISTIWLYQRMRLNTKRVKEMIFFRGYLERISLSAKIISSYLSPEKPTLQNTLCCSINNQIEYEKEKGQKYKIEFALFISLMAVMIASCRVFIF